MAQTKALVRLVKIKIANVTSQKDQVHEALENYVNKMTSKARETLQTEEQDVNTLNEINTTLEKLLNDLLQISSQLEDDTPTTQTPAEDQLSTSSSETLSLPQPLSTNQYEKLHDSEYREISKLQHRMEVLELAVSVCRNEISRASTDKNEVRDKVDKLEHHVQKVETSHSEGLDQQEERLASVEKLSQQTQSNMTKEIKDLQKTSKEQASKLGKVEKKLKKMKEEEQERWSQIDSIHTDVESLNHQQLVKIQGLEKHMETVTSQCDSLQDQVGKIEPVIQMSQELSHKISTLTTDEQVQELIQTSTATSRSMEELRSRVEDTERSVRGCVAQRERDENRRREMEDRVAVLEAQRQKDLDHYTKELEETNSLYKAVCQLVDQRVTPLRRLQRMLNDYHKQVEKREEISTRLDDVVKKVEEISTQVDRHERSLIPARVGFTAYYPVAQPVPSGGSRITDFTDVLCNEGNHYNPSTGEFICPIDGLYLVSATLWQYDNGIVNTCIKLQSANSATPATEVCRVYTNQVNPSCCGVGVVRLQVGDRVYVEVLGTAGTPKLYEISSFSCVLIT